MGPFTLVMIMLLAGCFSAITALDNRGIRGQVLWMIYRLGLIADTGSIPGDLYSTDGFGIWLFAFVLIITIIMV
eukprot:CAMPEP_0197695280 /NCGR_PEP_ID=MMETSP1338-20131121/114996_1 /TAXON_ID=43686 ORGANISM="Pelagodinium beii, Strain RCC1491" /NCGR_SAMPLE_ID=MMETSP1338 /ASSEMBLY_ACC=CAM_ASM_000754 /LENGTH=73 /DNA_ID=CAMNT_0043278243 /DNA_START=107 /DNA_END=324 /DNA_ORIENTATION=+